MFWNEKMECMPKNEIGRMQYDMIKRLVSDLYENNRFYHDRMRSANILPSDIKSLDDVSKLPFMYKQDLRDNYPTKLFTAKQKDIVRYHVSSGTSGKPTLVGYTRNDLDYWAESLARSLTSIGLTDRDVIQISYGYGLFSGGLGLHYGAEKIGATVLPSSTGNTERQIELMMDLDVTAIACTPSYLIHIGEVAEKMGVSIKKDTKLKKAIVGAEPWTIAMRDNIQNNLGVKAYDVYGTSEMAGPLFTECEEQNGIHLQSDMVYAEIIDPETEEILGPGEKGEIVVTMLRKEALPIVRFRIKDLTCIMEGDCPCGRTSPRISKISGRSDDMLIIRGINVFPSQIEHILMQIPEVGNQYMITVDRVGALDTMKVQVELKPEAFSDMLDDILKIKKHIEGDMKKILNVAVNVELMSPGSLPRFEGKAKRVIDKRVI